MAFAEAHQAPTIRVFEHPVDWDNLAWSSLRRLLPVGPSPGEDRQIEIAARTVLRKAAAMGTVFVNPRFTLLAMAGASTPEFVQEARNAQRCWLKDLRNVLCSSRRVKREIKNTTPLIRQLAYTGLLVIHGKHAHPQRWPDALARKEKPVN